MPEAVDVLGPERALSSAGIASVQLQLHAHNAIDALGKSYDPFE
jgi:hypothetical protein